MLVAISQRQDKNSHGNYMDSLEDNYVNYLEQLGIEIIPVPNNTKNVKSYFDNLPIEGVILSGGNDIDPNSYGSENSEGLSLALERDKTERSLLKIAIERNLPILGICRGMQFINVYFGGKIIDLRQGFLHPPATNHIIKIEKYVELLGESAEVNSYHNQGLTAVELSSKLKLFAKSDEIIEGFYHPSLPIAGIQWHPERKSPDTKINVKLVRAFVNQKLFWEMK